MGGFFILDGNCTGRALLILNSKSFIPKFKSSLATLSTSIWYTLRNPSTTGILMGVVAMVLLLGLIIPQLPTAISPDTARATWLSGLPGWIQPWGELLYFLGFSQLFQSIWYWFPLALLLLSSLIALADYGPGSWQRLQKTVPSLNWQHPLAHRAEYSARLPESPDKFLESFKTSLLDRGFWLYENSEPDQRLIGLGWRRWSWLGPVAFYMGLIGFIAALLMSYYFLQVDTFTLLPLEPQANSLFQGEFTLADIDSSLGVTSVNYLAEATGSSPLPLTWRLYQPALFQQALILPLAFDPILQVEAHNPSGALLRLIPSQENLAPAERLNLLLAETNTPLYFLIPAAGLAFQVLPDPANENIFNVQVRRGSELSPSAELKVQAGQPFELDGLAVTMSLNSNLNVMALRDPAWPLYLVSLILVAVAGLLIYWQWPLQLWLIPDVKGRGGQLYSVVEKLGPKAKLPQFLEKLLNPESE